jgi:predicted permease
LIAQLANILLPVFLLAAIGYGWRLTGAPFEREFVTRLVMNISGPCLTINTLGNLTVAREDFVSMMGAAAALFIVTIAAGWLVLALLRRRDGVLWPVISIGNTGNVGLPLCVFAFGAEGLGLGIAVFVVNSVGQFIFTPVAMSGEPPLRTLLTTPVVYGALIGLLLMFTDASLPEWLDSTIGLLGGLLIPLMLVTLGNTLAGLKMHHLTTSIFWGSLRIVLGFGVAVCVAWAFDLEGVARGVLILQGSMPAAVFTYFFAARFDRSPDDVAGIVLSSTLISALTLPFLVAYVLNF